MRFDALKKRAISLPPFVKRHMQGRLHSICYIVDIVGIHDKGFLKFFGGSGKSSVPSLTNNSQLTANHSACGNEERHLHISGPGEPGSS